jgi:hypothetical protein
MLKKLMSLLGAVCLLSVLLGCGGGEGRSGTCQGGPEVCKDAK